MHRINGMRVLVDGAQVATLYNQGASNTIYNVNRKAREVRITGGTAGDAHIQIAEVEVYGYKEDIKCYDSSGKEYRGGQSYTRSDGKVCTCGASGMICRCEGQAISCPSGTFKWTDQDTCIAQCIRNPAYCSSSGDPHYRTFDGKYYDFHGQCTYQAASCGDFKVNFKNVDLHNRAPRYTGRAELVHNGVTYSIANQYQAKVDGQAVQVPYVKTFTNGDRVEIVNNGQLEIILTQPSKGREPAVRIRATNAGRYIHAELWLHGSCADVTEGLCGNWNGNPHDDLTGGSPNSLGDLHQLHDEDCPAPPDPYHPCDDIEGGHESASVICDALKRAPFTSCHSKVPYGDKEGGVYLNCMTDVCHCFMDKSCACSQFDNYASSCIDAGVDLSNWRHGVDFCPYECPEGLTYLAAANIPAPTCLERSPKKTGTARGCFCPSGQYLQDEVCVSASQCKCLHEGVFYNPGEKIRKEGECQECTCASAGQMSCSSLTCRVPSCAADQILAKKDDVCCPYCESDWVVAENPEETVKQGQNVVFTCQVHADVAKKDIVWTKDGDVVSEGVSKDGLRLRIPGAQDSGAYTCTATKGTAKKSAQFELTVEVVEPPEPEPTVIFKPTKSKVSCKAKKKCQVVFRITKKDGEVNPKSVKFCKLVGEKLTNCKKMKYKKKKGTYHGNISKPKAGDSGDYVCVVPDGGKDVVSDPVPVTIK